MKKPSRTMGMFLSGLAVIFIIYYIGFLAPYNLNGRFNANGLGIMNSNSFKEIRELSEYFNGYDIEKVKYLGNNSYEVFTDRGNFIVMTDYSDSMYWKYKIFKYDKEVEYFTNPM